VCKVEKRLLVMAAKCQRWFFFPIKLSFVQSLLYFLVMVFYCNKVFQAYFIFGQVQRTLPYMSISRDHAFFLKFNLGEYPTLAKAMGFLIKAGHCEVEPSASLIFVKPMAKGFIVHNKPSNLYSSSYLVSIIGKNIKNT
jgi:hypothetical protein